MKIGVFCSANECIDNDFFRMTEELGKWIGENGYDLIYGGCDMGLMRVIGQSVRNNGGRIIGVVPRIIERGGQKAGYLDVEIPVDNLSDRKDIILAKSDCILALPGGIGTLDEVFTVVAAKAIGYHNKRVLLYNMKNFWDKTIQMLDDMQARGMTRGDYRNTITAVSSIDEIENAIKAQTQ